MYYCSISFLQAGEQDTYIFNQDPSHSPSLATITMLKFVVAAVSILFFARILLAATWNLFFHPLRHLPGPKLWIAFPFLRHLAGIRGTFDQSMREFHNKYGEVVRFTPHEVSFITAQAWRDIYGHGHRQLPKALNSGSNTSDILAANDADHSRYRKSLSHAFSAKGLQAQEPILMTYVDKLIERLKGVAESNKPANMARWYNLATFDLIGDLAFGEPFGGLENSTFHHWVSAIFDFVKVVPFIRAKDNYPLLVSLFLASMPSSFIETQKKQREHARITVRKRLDNTALHGRGDFMDSMLRHRGKENGLSDNELVANANILIIAGSETSASLLSGVTFWLLRTPEALEKVTREVRSALESEADITFQNVSTKLPYMLACINEAFRLYPPVPGGLQRVTLPSTPTQISGYEIPPNVSQIFLFGTGTNHPLDKGVCPPLCRLLVAD